MKGKRVIHEGTGRMTKDHQGVGEGSSGFRQGLGRGRASLYGLTAGGQRDLLGRWVWRSCPPPLPPVAVDAAGPVPTSAGEGKTSRRISGVGRGQAGVRYPNPSRVHACVPFGNDPDPPYVLARKKCRRTSRQRPLVRRVVSCEYEGQPLMRLTPQIATTVATEAFSAMLTLSMMVSR